MVVPVRGGTAVLALDHLRVGDPVDAYLRLESAAGVRDERLNLGTAVTVDQHPPYAVSAGPTGALSVRRLALGEPVPGPATPGSALAGPAAPEPTHGAQPGHDAAATGEARPAGRPAPAEGSARVSEPAGSGAGPSSAGPSSAGPSRLPSRRPVVAVVLAGGVGTRIGAGQPKQLLRLGERTILEWAVGAFVASPVVGSVLVVTAAGLVDQVRALLSGGGLDDVTVVEGGVLRSDSTRAAITFLGDLDADVLFHDAARPLVDGRIIADCVRALETAEAVTAAVASTDTVAEADSGRVTGILDRSRLRNIQTPQGFRLATIRDAYRLMDADPDGLTNPTDDCGVVLRYRPDVPVVLVEGSMRNLKVTHPDDLLVAERLLPRSDRHAE